MSSRVSSNGRDGGGGGVDGEGVDEGGGDGRVDLILNMKLGHERLFSTLSRQIYYFIL
jgi:hypothetical protein